MDIDSLTIGEIKQRYKNHVHMLCSIWGEEYYGPSYDFSISLSTIADNMIYFEDLCEYCNPQYRLEDFMNDEFMDDEYRYQRADAHDQIFIDKIGKLETEKKALEKEIAQLKKNFNK